MGEQGGRVQQGGRAPGQGAVREQAGVVRGGHCTRACTRACTSRQQGSSTSRCRSFGMRSRAIGQDGRPRSAPDRPHDQPQHQPRISTDRACRRAGAWVARLVGGSKCQSWLPTCRHTGRGRGTRGAGAGRKRQGRKRRTHFHVRRQLCQLLLATALPLPLAGLSPLDDLLVAAAAALPPRCSCHRLPPRAVCWCMRCRSRDVQCTPAHLAMVPMPPPSAVHLSCAHMPASSSLHASQAAWSSQSQPAPLHDASLMHGDMAWRHGDMA